MNFTKNTISQPVFDHDTSGLNQNNHVRCMHTAWGNILTHATRFLSHDVFNVIYAKTSITPSFFMLKTK